MEKLLRQEELYFCPIGNVFNLDEAEEVIKKLGFYWRYPLVPNLFLIFIDEPSRSTTQEQYRLDPKMSLPYVLLIQISETEMQINQFAGSDFDDYSKMFICWILKNYKCNVYNEMGTDLTSSLPNPSELK